MKYVFVRSFLDSMAQGAVPDIAISLSFIMSLEYELDILTAHD